MKISAGAEALELVAHEGRQSRVSFVFDAQEGRVITLEAESDALYQVDITSGVATLDVEVDRDFGSLGFEVHPGNGRFFACSDEADLYEIDPTTGVTTLMGGITEAGKCNNLAAPCQNVDCI